MPIVLAIIPIAGFLGGVITNQINKDKDRKVAEALAMRQQEVQVDQFGAIASVAIVGLSAFMAYKIINS